VAANVGDYNYPSNIELSSARVEGRYHEWGRLLAVEKR
jgi:hypothetical protein